MFIITFNQEQLGVDDVDFNENVIITVNGKIPLSDLKKIPRASCKFTSSMRFSLNYYLRKINIYI